eukprot:SAG31_NODE_29671_length_391_cov_1.393836_1_plen_76_part_10
MQGFVNYCHHHEVLRSYVLAFYRWQVCRAIIALLVRTDQTFHRLCPLFHELSLFRRAIPMLPVHSTAMLEIWFVET